MEEQKRYVTIKIKRRVSGQPGPPTFLAPGELAVNEVDNAIYIGTNTSNLSASQTIDHGTF
jgi:hypothetical protein